MGIYETHAAHCCAKHGCKYASEHCPVVARRVEQKYPCDVCEETEAVLLTEAEKDALRTAIAVRIERLEIGIAGNPEQTGFCSLLRKQIDRLRAAADKLDVELP